MTVPVVFDVREMIELVAGDCHAWTPDDWQTASTRVGRLPAVTLLDALADQLRPDTFASAVPEAWVSADYAEMRDQRTRWLTWFRRAGYTHELVRADPPAKPLRLWRGAIWELRRGMSWTDDRDRAQWFADRAQGVRVRGGGEEWVSDGMLFTTLAPSRSLLAYVHEMGRTESEYVIDPHGLRITRALSAQR